MIIAEQIWAVIPGSPKSEHSFARLGIGPKVVWGNEKEHEVEEEVS